MCFPAFILTYTESAIFMLSGDVPRHRHRATTTSTGAVPGAYFAELFEHRSPVQRRLAGPSGVPSSDRSRAASRRWLASGVSRPAREPWRVAIFMGTMP